jgi:hydrogenase expression/formation protein HypC
MCLAIPGEVIEISDESGLKMGKIDYGGTTNDACLAYVPEVEVGQYVIVHAGFALNIIDKEEAQKRFELWDEMTAKAADEGVDIFGMPLSNTSEEQ